MIMRKSAAISVFSSSFVSSPYLHMNIHVHINIHMSVHRLIQRRGSEIASPLNFKTKIKCIKTKPKIRKIIETFIKLT